MKVRNLPDTLSYTKRTHLFPSLVLTYYRLTTTKVKYFTNRLSYIKCTYLFPSRVVLFYYKLAQRRLEIHQIAVSTVLICFFQVLS